MNKNYITLKKCLIRDKYKLKYKWIKEIYFVYRRKKYLINLFDNYQVEEIKINNIINILINILKNRYDENDIIFLNKNIEDIKVIEKNKKYGLG